MLIAPQFKGEILFVEVSSSQYQLMHYFNLQISDLPQIVLVDIRQAGHNLRYRLIDYLYQLKYSSESSHHRMGSESNPMIHPDNIIHHHNNNNKQPEDEPTDATTATSTPSTPSSGSSGSSSAHNSHHSRTYM